MKETERNKRLFMLLQKLIQENEREFIELLQTMIEKETPSLKMTFKIMTEDYLKKETDNIT